MIVERDRTPDPEDSIACLECMAITQDLLDVFTEDDDDDVTGWASNVELGDFEQRSLEQAEQTGACMFARPWAYMRQLGRSIGSAFGLR